MVSKLYSISVLVFLFVIVTDTLAHYQNVYHQKHHSGYVQDSASQAKWSCVNYKTGETKTIVGIPSVYQDESGRYQIQQRGTNQPQQTTTTQQYSTQPPQQETEEPFHGEGIIEERDASK